ncbi:MAG TPA: carboxypeptidase regulatory-like domain-containing protein [Gemmatimonas sp.]|nr:carboxypeptidase regulatory-like domain-containing protein [Gemmatimonas sp.]
MLKRLSPLSLLSRLMLSPVALPLVVFCPATVHAQATEGYVSGTIRDAGAPMAGVTVVARNEATGTEERRVTDTRGRFVFAQLPIGGPYAITARQLGFRPVRRTGLVLNLGDRVTLDLVLERSAQELLAIDVRADRESKRSERVGASTVISEQEIRQLPIQDRSFADLAIIAPTTSRAGTGGIITSSSSIAGGRVTGTDIRVDGVQAKNTLWGAGFGRGPYSISVEAVREFEVVTNVYDVTQGRQGAGAVNVATRAGTNTTKGSLFGYNRNQAFTTNTNFLNQRITTFDNWQFGGALGGALKKDKLHYFVAYDRQQVAEPFSTLQVDNAADWSRLQVAPDSVRRFLDILTREYGLPSDRQVGVFDRTNALNTVFGRLDWQINGAHRATLRTTYSDWFYSNSIPDRELSVLESRGNQKSREVQVMGSVKSNLGSSWTNDMRVAYTNRILENEPNTRLPRAWVSVTSTLPTGVNGSAQILQFGGQRTSPELQTEESYQVVNVLRRDLDRSAFTLGTDHSLNNLSMFVSIETDGLFQFPSLAALEQRRPSSFARLVPLKQLEPRMRQWVYDGGVFAQGEYRVRPDLNVTAGVRADLSAFLTGANANPLVEQTFGRRTDVRPTDLAIQPRAQITWTPGEAGRDLVRLGTGYFTSQPHYMVQINHLLNDGTQLGDVLLTGAAAPTADFGTYRQSFANVPGIPQGSAQRPSYINMFADGFKVPRTWKSDVAYQRRMFNGNLTLGASAQYAHTSELYRYYDLNLRAEPEFRLANEGNRAVFVPAASITATGGRNPVLARPFAQFQRVLELRSDASQHQKAFVVDGALRLPRGGSINGSFTWNETRDNSSFNCCIAITSVFTPVPSDPRLPSWGASNTDFRHKLVLFGATPEIWGFQFSARVIGQSGTPWSPVVAQDINGDDVGVGSSFANQNDLAFIFDPATPGLRAGFADSLRLVYANPANTGSSYLQSRLGQIADRNTIRNPFVTQVDVRVSQKLPSLRGQRALLTLDVFNAAALVNHAWGAVRAVPGANQTLLNVIGFDQSTRRYSYRVNPNFGRSVKSGNRYQMQLGVRYEF